MRRLIVLAVVALAILAMQFMANCSSPLEPDTGPNPIPPKPPDTIHDTIQLIVDHFDTVYDTTFEGDTVEYWDTVTIFDTTFNTDTVTLTDTMLDTTMVYDTTFVTDTLLDTTMVYDTTFVTDTLNLTDTLLDTVPVYDTTFITDTLLDTTMVYDTTMITDTLTLTDTLLDTVPIYDTTFITDTLLDTTMVYDTTLIIDTVTLTDTIEFYDTIEIVDTVCPDTICPIYKCTQISSDHPSEIWMLQNGADYYNLHFTSHYVDWDPSEKVLVDIDGTQYIWDPMTEPVLTIERWLDEDAVVTISYTLARGVECYPIDICVCVKPIPLE